MAKKNNTLLLVGGVAVVGFLLWKRSAAAQLPAPVPTGAPGLNPTLNSALVTPTQAMTATTANQVQPSQVVTVAAGNQVPPDILQWVGTLSPANQVQAKNALQVMTSQEIAGLEDIVHNDFYGNGITTPAQRTFWDAWRVKYHVLDGTVS